MSNDDRSQPSVLKGIGGFLLAVIVINVLVRILPLADIDLPAISLPDLPAWVHAVVQIKNWAFVVIAAVVVACVALDQHGKRSAGGGDDAR